jgi:predicted O-methyltransferase YrrM
MPEWAAAADRPIAVSGVYGWLSIPAPWGIFLLRLVRELLPRSCLELGSGLGISAAYMGAALELNGNGRLTTLDAAADWAGIAAEGFGALGLDERIELQIGPIEDTLPAALRGTAPVDLAFLDAEHTQEATRRHFEAVLPSLSDGAVLVFDDVDLSPEMRRAWKRIRRHRRVSVAVAVRRMGLAVISDRKL